MANKPVVCKPNRLVRPLYRRKEEHASHPCCSAAVAGSLAEQPISGACWLHASQVDAAPCNSWAPGMSMRLLTSYSGHAERGVMRWPCLGEAAPKLLLLHAQAFEMALRAAGADAATSVFCDDSTRNVKAAQEAGIFSVLVRGYKGMTSAQITCSGTAAGSSYMQPAGLYAAALVPALHIWCVA